MINWIEVLDVIFRGCISLITLFLVTKMIGKKQVSQLSVFDYVIGISIGNFAAEMTINLDSPYINGTIAVILFGLVAYTVSILSLKNLYLRRFFMGVPTLLIQNGKLLKKGLRKVKLDTNDFLEEARSNGYFDLNEIEYAIMEANGKISFLPKDKYKPVTKQDMNIQTQKIGLCANVIIDGKVIKDVLKKINKTESWLYQQLKIHGYKTTNKILLATVDVNEKISIYENNVNEKINNIVE